MDRMHGLSLLGISLGVVVVAIVTIRHVLHGASPMDLGSVSSHWVVEHRDSSD
jgi:hypothetical protein